jgi:hypothetical protein
MFKRNRTCGFCRTGRFLSLGCHASLPLMRARNALDDTDTIRGAIKRLVRG